VNTIPNYCFCGNPLNFSNCCQPIIDGSVNAPDAEALMRSRFSAYVIKAYPYILQTYAPEQQANLSLVNLKQHAQDTQWLSLQVIQHNVNNNKAQVEFKAYYCEYKRFYVMHELSDFILLNDQWFYIAGVVQKDSGEYTPQRNSLCLCGSGKKFKKCCAI
jgi:SEC-C motif-containing protein